ncbi:MAG: outer membrane protein OmpA-like peptidoglycan-associated protein [Saprospiraceae bacterium]|jgi:outer membrane protein OmpA-like peptidoglycan-associated protein
MLNRFLLILLSFFAVSAMAQQSSSKSKSKDKLYEKEGERQIDVKNSVLINSPNLEFAPVFYQNGLVYVTSRYKSGAVDKKINETFFELFYSELDAAGNPTKPQEFSVNINSQAHEGPVSFSRDGERMYFTRNNMQKGMTKADSKGITRLKIYEAKRGTFDWENVVEMPFNSDEYSVMHPTLSADGKILYFASDMPGGYGGFDLYMVTRNRARWTSPVNLGKRINTDKNDVFPFFHDSGTLFFSSNGHSGQGGLDIFSVDLSNENSKGVVINLGSPFNSKDDDLSLILNEEGTQGYFTSGRKGGVGKDDIYQFDAPNGLNNLGERPMLNAQIIVVNEATGERLSDAGVRIFEQADDGFLTENNAYEVELQPVSSSSTELVMKLRRKDAKALGEPDFYTDANGELVQPLETGKKYLILVTKEGFRNGELMTTGDDVNGAGLRVNLVEERCITVGGSLRDAGSSTSLAGVKISITNSCDGTKEAFNTDASGNFTTCLPEGCDYKINYRKVGYTSATKNISVAAGAQDLDLDLNYVLSPAAASYSTVVEPIRTGSTIVLENIYYDFNKSAIRKGEARELESLANLMSQYPSMKIDLIAHTDSRGTAEYNMDLSMRRAQSAKHFLMTRGIVASRVNAFGYGETQPRNSCVDGVKCDEKDYQYNRRTEVKVMQLDEDVEVRYRK